MLYQPVRFVSIIFAFSPSEFLILCVLLSFSVCLRCSHCHCSHFPIELLLVSKSRLYHTTLFSVVAVTEIAASSSRHHHLPTHPERRGAPSPNTRGNATFATTTAQAPTGSFSATLHPHVWSNRYSPSTKQTTNVPNTGTLVVCCAFPCVRSQGKAQYRASLKTKQPLTWTVVVIVA